MHETCNSAIDGLLVPVGSRCNHRCTFCGLDSWDCEVPAEQVLSAAAEAVRLGHKRIILCGGEPTMRRDLPRLAGGISRLGLRLGLMTNGRMLLYPKLLSALLDCGLDAVLLWLHAPDAATHDALVRVPGAFDQTVQVLRQLLELPDMQVEVRTVVAPLNEALLPAMEAWLNGLRGKHSLCQRLVRSWDGDAPCQTEAMRSNSFDFVETGASATFVPSSAGCQGFAPALPGGPLRNVFLSRGGALSVFRTDTGDFPEAEIADIKHRYQQLYVDTSSKVALDDYQADVKQLRMLPECAACPTQHDCATAWKVDEQVPFYREERWLKGELGRMKGRVLDVGCGDLRYQPIIAGLVEKGDIEYHALDPDREAMKRLRASGIKMTMHVGEIETFEWSPGYFDYVLMLRSINHFRDLGVTFQLVRRLLRNYGSLIIADGIPFALLRSSEKARQAHTALEPHFEHYRNFSSAQVLDFLRGRDLPFVINVHRPVLPKTSNLWLLKLIKIEEDA